jgi:type II secretory ATPase GspE/PulE/Tfp pilus assembly ATPase PilB-like protein
MPNQQINHILQPTDIAWLKVNFDVLKLFTKEEASKNQILTWSKEGKKWEQLSLLTTNNEPDKLNQIITNLQNKNYTVEIFYTDDIGFRLALWWYDQMLAYDKQLELRKDYRLEVTGNKAIQEIKDTLVNKGQFSEVDLISELVRLSFQSWASDMHLQEEQQGVLLRVRRSGVLETIALLTHDEFVVYLMKIKYIAWVKMNIAQTPQDGRFDFQVWADGKQRKIDARVSFIPGLRGESVVIRFLDSSKSIMTLSDMGFSPHHIPIITRNLQKNSGIILVTWPTGGGKTTTLYSMLEFLNTPDIKIVTLEDPVEYEIPGIQQSQIHEDQNYGFADGVRAVLRHDPDVILIGEIRDLDTANAAINAALTGHLVFSTLHTNSALDTISRLLNLGVKPYLLAPAINMIIWQRLVRKLSDDKVPKKLDKASETELIEGLSYVKEHFPDLLKDDPNVCEPSADWDGYTGRLAVWEIFEPDEQDRMQLLEGKLWLEMFEGLRKKWYLTMQDDALIKVYRGVTTMEEVRRVI